MYQTNYLIHFGRSKKDGAPGPGTGNYPRHGSGGVRIAEEYNKLKKDPTTGIYKLNRYLEKRAAKKEAKQAAKLEKKKQKWAKSATDLKLHSDKFTADEMNEAVRKLSYQIDYETKLNDLGLKRLAAARAYTSQLANTTADAANILNNAYNIYKNVDNLVKFHTEKNKPKTELEKVNSENDLVFAKKQLEENKQALASLTDKKNVEATNKLNELNIDTALRTAEFNNAMARNPELAKAIERVAVKSVNDLSKIPEGDEPMFTNSDAAKQLVNNLKNIVFSTTDNSNNNKKKK